MLVLFETPAGFALFKVLNEQKLSKTDVSLYIHIYVYTHAKLYCIILVDTNSGNFMFTGFMERILIIRYS